MPTFNYTNDIPEATHNPSTDQPDMKINTNSIDSIIAVDHYSFEEANLDGTHRQVQLRDTAGGNGTIPAGLQGNGWETIYSSATAGSGELWFVRGASATGIQLTGPGTPLTGDNGYTFLPGGILLQWGRKSLSGTGQQNVTINYLAEGNIAMPNDTFIAVATLRNSSASTTNNPTVSIGTRTSAGFILHYSGDSGYNEFQWIAIGF